MKQHRSLTLLAGGIASVALTLAGASVASAATPSDNSADSEYIAPSGDPAYAADPNHGGGYHAEGAGTSRTPRSGDLLGGSSSPGGAVSGLGPAAASPGGAVSGATPGGLTPAQSAAGALGGL